MTAKEYLKEVYKRRRLMESTQQHLEELRAQAEGVGAIRYDKDRVQISPSDHMSEVMTVLIEQEELYAKQILAYHKAVYTRTKMIERMPDSRYAVLLTLRYIDCLRFEEIAVRMAYSWKHVLRLHGEALDAFADQFKDAVECDI